MANESDISQSSGSERFASDTSDTAASNNDTMDTIPETSGSDTDEIDGAAGVQVVIPRLRNEEVVVEDEVMNEDDVILMEPEIETINLCTQAIPRPSQFARPMAPNEVIEIEDSPLTQRPVARTGRQPVAGPARNNRTRSNARLVAAPYVAASYPSKAPSPSKALNFDDSLNATQTPNIRVSCPICFDSVVGRDPVSTVCGHIFCKACLVNAIKISKKCPMCRRSLAGRNQFHALHLGA